jgi:hypothetical protein
MSGGGRKGKVSWVPLYKLRLNGGKYSAILSEQAHFPILGNGLLNAMDINSNSFYPFEKKVGVWVAFRGNPRVSPTYKEIKTGRIQTSNIAESGGWLSLNP